MSFKSVLLCAQLCLVKTVFTQCFGPRPGLMGDGFGPRSALMADALGPMGAPCGPGRFESSLLLENYPMPTPGLSIMTDDLLIEGIVSVSGNLPFLGTVAIEGVVPTEGHGSVVYGCGNGDVRILSENKGYGPELGPMGGPVGGPFAGPFPGPFAGPMGPGGPGPRGPAFGPVGPTIDSGMAAAANTAAMAAAAKSAGQAAKMASIGL